MKIKNLTQLRNYIEKAINNSLEKEVFEVIKQTQLKHITNDVLSVYSPKIYMRRDNLGIDDPKNIVFQPVKSGTLKIQNVTKFNTEYETENKGLGLVNLIEYGHKTSGYLYDYPDDLNYTQPRPFIANTKTEIKQTKSYIKAIKTGLNRNKIKCK